METWAPNGESPAPKAIFENGRAYEPEDMGTDSGATAECPPPETASESMDLNEELGDCATRAEHAAIQATVERNAVTFTNLVPP